MALKRETKAVSDVLASDENASLSAEEVAERVIDALDAVRLRATRFYTVAQVIRDNQPSRPYVIGPFSTFGRALEGAYRGTRGQDIMDHAEQKFRFMVGVGIEKAADLSMMYTDIRNDAKAEKTVEKWRASK